MSEARSFKIARGLIAFCVLAGLALPVWAETISERSVETRFQLDVQVPDSAIKAYLPAGWTLNVATQGAAKDANLRVVFIDRLTIHAPDGKPVGNSGTNRLVYLVAPVKDAAGATAQLVIGGITEDAGDAPGPFGVYLSAKIHTMRRSTSSDTGPILDSQDWLFTAASGELLELHVKYERGVAARRDPSDTKFYSAKNPSFYQISRQEQILDVLRNATTNPPDRVKEFSFKAAGGTFAKLFDGTEKLLSWDNFVWVSRSVILP